MESENRLREKLKGIVGLDPLKDQLLDFCANAAIDKIRKNNNMQIQIKRPVMLFTGNPGTGKTSVAMIVAGTLEHSSNNLLIIIVDDIFFYLITFLYSKLFCNDTLPSKGANCLSKFLFFHRHTRPSWVD